MFIDVTIASANPLSTENNMRMASWNVNSIRARLPLVLAWLDETTPDVVAFQETKAQDADFPKEELVARGYHVATFGQKSYNGVALISREPLEDVEPLGEDARYIEASTYGIRVASAYVPNGQGFERPAFAEKEAFFAFLSARTAFHAHGGGASRFVLAGDFNVAMGDADVGRPEDWDDKLLCSPLERRWLRGLLQAGLQDPAHRPDAQTGKNAFTWWDYRWGWKSWGRGLRIDALLTSQDLACLRTGVDTAQRRAPRPSDHAPVWVVVDNG